MNIGRFIMEGNQAALLGKLKITGVLKVETGMHIGGSSEFAPIGAVDSPFIRDVLTQQPIIPGSSLKGKMRTLLARNSSQSYILNAVDNDTDVVKRLFGSSVKQNIKPARLQFFDLFVTDDSKELFEAIETDTYMGEVKSENAINRLSGEANPRQIERVPAGMIFKLNLVYNIESDADEVMIDMNELRKAFELLEVDYLGGHGSRGYGRVSINDLRILPILVDEKLNLNIENIQSIFRK